MRGYDLLPSASAAVGALTLGGAIGLCVSLILLKTGLIKRSYPEAESEMAPADEAASDKEPTDAAESENEPTAEAESEPADMGADYSHRREVLKEVVFLGPVVICAAAAYALRCALAVLILCIIKHHQPLHG